MTINSLVFCLTGATTITSAFEIFWENEQLAVKLLDDFSAKNHRASWYGWFFRQKLAFGLQTKLLYSNETLQSTDQGEP